MKANREDLPGLKMAYEVIQKQSPIGSLMNTIASLIDQASAAPEQEPVDFEYPVFHDEGMGCGLEDRGITDRYEAMRYGFDEALDQMSQVIQNLGPLYTHADPSEVAQLRTDLAHYKNCFEQSEQALERVNVLRRKDRAHATQRADAAERKLGEAVGLLQRVHDAETADGQCYPSERRILLCNIEGYLISASAEPAECGCCGRYDRCDDDCDVGRRWGGGMSTYVWCELVCDHCSQTICGEFSTADRIPRASLKKDAEEKGAVFAFDDVFCCKEHHEAAQPKSIAEAQSHD